MPTSTTNYGLIKPGTDDPILIGQLNDNMDTIDTVLKDHSDKIDAAALGIKYKGEVNYYADLPNNAEIGDAYTVKYAGSSGTTPDGTEYVWGTVSGTNQWINFSKDSYTKAEVDALLSLKANIADIPSPSTAAPAMDGTASPGTSEEYARADHVHPSDTSKQDALTAAQLAAVNSGINSTKVGQIETNKNNISVNWERGKNALDVSLNNAKANISNIGFTWSSSAAEKNSITFTFNADKTVTVTSTGADDLTLLYISTEAKDWYGYTLNGCPNGGSESTYELRSSSPALHDYGSGTNITSHNLTNIVIIIRSGWSGTATFKPMLRLSSNADAAYQPYAMSNVELTEQTNTNTTNISNRTGDGVALTANTNLNDIVDYGQYPASTAVTATLINLPDVAKTAKGRLLVLGAHVASNLRVTQIWLCDMSTSTTKGKIMMRQKYGDATWTHWFMFEGTEIVPT